MNGQEALHGFQLDNHAILHHDIQAVTAIETDRFIDHRQRHLTLKHYAILRKLMTEAFLVSRFQQAWTQVPVNFDGEANNPSVNGSF